MYGRVPWHCSENVPILYNDDDGVQDILQDMKYNLFSCINDVKHWFKQWLKQPAPQKPCYDVSILKPDDPKGIYIYRVCPSSEHEKNWNFSHKFIVPMHAHVDADAQTVHMTDNRTRFMSYFPPFKGNTMENFCWDECVCLCIDPDNTYVHSCGNFRNDGRQYMTVREYLDDIKHKSIYETPLQTMHRRGYEPISSMFCGYLSDPTLFVWIKDDNYKDHCVSFTQLDKENLGGNDLST